jgi:hypothetical protein
MGHRGDVSDGGAVIWPADGAPHWQLVTDTVMGGVSQGTLTRETIDGRAAMRMRGDVSTDNNGGFIQIAMDLLVNDHAIDASAFTGVAVDVFGNDETYDVRLRSMDATRPQQSWRADFVADRTWRTIKLPFADFVPHRIAVALDVTRLRRIGLVAIGRAFNADLAVARLAFY